MHEGWLESLRDTVVDLDDLPESLVYAAANFDCLELSLPELMLVRGPLGGFRRRGSSRGRQLSREPARGSW
jgi:hypothetical protein